MFGGQDAIDLFWVSGSRVLQRPDERGPGLKTAEIFHALSRCCKNACICVITQGSDKKQNPNRAVNWVIQVERIRQFSKLASATRRWRVGKFAVTIAHEISFLAGRRSRWTTGTMATFTLKGE
jgi:hypothetical protein